MTCRLYAALALGLAACAAVDAPLVEVTGRATVPLTLDPGMAPPDGGHFRWKLVSRPEGSQAAPPAVAFSTTFTPDLRGTYLVELWIEDGLAEELAERFEIDAAGMPPVPGIDASDEAPIGATVSLDGGPSYSPEGRTIVYAWQLLSRPRDSAATLTSATAPTTTFVPDVAGDYTIELDVFDGELWSGHGDRVTIHAAAP